VGGALSVGPQSAGPQVLRRRDLRRRDRAPAGAPLHVLLEDRRHDPDRRRGPDRRRDGRSGRRGRPLQHHRQCAQLRPVLLPRRDPALPLADLLS